MLVHISVRAGPDLKPVRRRVREPSHGSSLSVCTCHARLVCAECLSCENFPPFSPEESGHPFGSPQGACVGGHVWGCPPCALCPPTLVLAWLSVVGHVPRSRCSWKSACGLDQCVPMSELSAQPGADGMERVPVGRRAGAGQTKELLKGPEYGGRQHGRACCSHKEKCTTLYQKKCHICTVEQEVFGNTEWSIRTKCKRKLRSIWKRELTAVYLEPRTSLNTDDHVSAFLGKNV